MEKVYLRGVLIGEIEKNTFITYRNNIFRKFWNFPISKTILELLDSKGVENIKIIWTERGKTDTFTLAEYITGKEWQNGEDIQLCPHRKFGTHGNFKPTFKDYTQLNKPKDKGQTQLLL